MASLGFDKSYRETVVLMTRSYLSKLSSVGSAESKTLAPEATTERVEVCIIYKCEIDMMSLSFLTVYYVKDYSLVRSHSRLFLQDFFSLLAAFKIQNCVQTIVIVCYLYAQM